MTGVFGKVVAAGAGAGGGAVASGLALWLLGLAWGGSSSADAVEATVALVPAPVSAAAVFVLVVAGALLSGFVRKEDPARLAEYLEQRDGGYVPEHARVDPEPAALTDGQEQALGSAARSRDELTYPREEG